MINLPAKFGSENNKGVNTPSIIVQFEDEVLVAEETLQADWAANTGESNVDYATQVGDVIILQDNIIENFESGGDFWYESPQSYGGQFAQSFQISSTAVIRKISMYLKYAASPSLCKINIYTGFSGSGGSGLVATTGDTTLTSFTGAWFDFVFSPDVQLTGSTTYYMEFVWISGGLNPFGYLDTGSGYSTGKGWANEIGGWVESSTNDFYFRVYDYFSLGYIYTDEMDVGSTPTNDGEWALSDISPSDSSILYEAWSSATGAFGGEELSLGTIADGDTITDLKRYYKVKATLNENTAKDETPTLQSIKADFTSYGRYSTAPVFGYEPVIQKIGSISTTIDDFKASTISQMTLTMGLTDSISTFLSSGYPKNKVVKIKAGFIADGWEEPDYINFFWGQIDDWSISGKDEVTITVKDFQKEWSAEIPEKWESAADDITWLAQHHCDVMLDILQNQINVRDSKIDIDSFNVVKAALSGYVVTRTITDDPVEAKKLMEELRVLTSTYFLPQGDGSIKLKQWDSSEAAVETLTDADFKKKAWGANAKSLINRTDIYYGWDGDGDKASDYTAHELGTDVTSQDNHQETKKKEIKDKWTLAAGTTQIQALEANILDRYADPAAVLNVTLDMRKLYLETGDMVIITTSRAPSADMAGIVAKKFQIINRNLDFLGSSLNLKLLEV